MKKLLFCCTAFLSLWIQPFFAQKAVVEKIIEIVPVEKETEKRNGKEKVVERKIFPGYVLLEMIVDERSWYIVRNTPGVTGFVGSNTKPVPLTEEEANRILKAMGMDKPTELDVEVGDQVNITSGAFENFVATITEIDYSKSKIKGFAVTLAIGVILSMFSAITVTKFLLRFLISSNFTKNPAFFGVSAPKEVNK